jgi:hypothetical protein
MVRGSGMVLMTGSLSRGMGRGSAARSERGERRRSAMRGRRVFMGRW